MSSILSGCGGDGGCVGVCVGDDDDDDDDDDDYGGDAVKILTNAIAMSITVKLVIVTTTRTTMMIIMILKEACLHVLIHFSILRISVICHVSPADHLVNQKFKHFAVIFQSFSHICHACRYHFLFISYTIFTDLELDWGHKVNPKQNLLASFSSTLFI